MELYKTLMTSLIIPKGMKRVWVVYIGGDEIAIAPTLQELVKKYGRYGVVYGVSWR